MTPRTLKLNAHRTLEYFAPEDVAELQRQLEQCRVLLRMSDTDLRLAREQRDAAYKEIKGLRIQLREAGLLDDEEDDDAIW